MGEPFSWYLKVRADIAEASCTAPDDRIGSRTNTTSVGAGDDRNLNASYFEIRLYFTIANNSGRYKAFDPFT